MFFSGKVMGSIYSIEKKSKKFFCLLPCFTWDNFLFGGFLFFKKILFGGGTGAAANRPFVPFLHQQLRVLPRNTFEEVTPI